MFLGFFLRLPAGKSVTPRSSSSKKNDPFGEKIRELSSEKETNEFPRSSNPQYQIE